MFLLHKLSKRGWQLHERVVVLDEHFLHYYRKKPKGFEAGNVASLSKAKPKMSLKLAYITDVSKVNLSDIKKYSKIKK
jgi:hypothetical protein